MSNGIDLSSLLNAPPGQTQPQPSPQSQLPQASQTPPQQVDNSGNSGLFGMGPDFARNLLAFGASTMQAANARTPQGFLANGPGALGPIGAGITAAMQTAQEAPQLRAKLGYTQAQTGAINAQTAQTNLQTQLQQQRMNALRQVYTLWNGQSAPTDPASAPNPGSGPNSGAATTGPLTLPNGTQVPAGYKQNPIYDRLDRQYSISDILTPLDPAGASSLFEKTAAVDPRYQGPLAGAKAAAESRYGVTTIAPGGSAIPTSSIVGGGVPGGGYGSSPPQNAPAPAVGGAGQPSMSPPYSPSGTLAPMGPGRPNPLQGPVSLQAGGGQQPSGQSGGGGLVQLPGGGFTNTNSPLTVNMGRIGGNEAVSALAKSDAEALSTARTEAQGENANISTVKAIQDFLPKVATGWSAPTRLQASNILRTMGVPDQDVQGFTGIDPTAGQILDKKFMELSTAAVRQMGAREPGSVIAMFGKKYPNIESTPGTINLMTNAILMNSKYRQDFASGMENYLSNSINNYDVKTGQYRGLNGFQQSFNQANPPTNYLSAAEAMSGQPQAWSNPQVTNSVWSLIPSGSTYMAPDGTTRVKP